ncbi:RraA family protein [Pseudoclavibacter helvolus]|uniref:RraA family protein n=1 Tax=Pseudoclavibacter helvolus TaxID=255205 RepID=UPI003C70A488
MTEPTTTAAAQWPTGYFIGERAPDLPPELIQAFRDIPVAVAGDCLGRSVGAVGLHAYHGAAPLSGQAVTVKIRPGDNLMVHKAMMDAHEGDVIVIEGGGDLSQAVIGGLIRTSALAKRLGGFVIDGALRDVAEWQEGGMPAFALGHTHRGPTKDGPGQINVPVAIAGLVVNPGDLVLGDLDGVLAVPASRAESLLADARKHLEREARIRTQNEQGTADPERFNALLRSKGLPV